MALRKFTRADGREVIPTGGLDFRQFCDSVGNDVEILEEDLIIGCRFRLYWNEGFSHRHKSGLYMCAVHTGEFTKAKVRLNKYSSDRLAEAELPIFEISVGDRDGVVRTIGQSAISQIWFQQPIGAESVANTAVTELDLSKNPEVEITGAFFHRPEPDTIYYIPVNSD